MDQQSDLAGSANGLNVAREDLLLPYYVYKGATFKQDVVHSMSFKRNACFKNKAYFFSRSDTQQYRTQTPYLSAPFLVAIPTRGV